MKKKILLLLLAMCLFLCSCKTVIPNSEEAKEKLENLGYTVDLQVQRGNSQEEYSVDQVVILNAYRDGELQLQVYYFCKEEDTEKFYNAHSESLKKNQQVFKKNRYSIYRGTVAGRDDFLREE